MDVEGIENKTPILCGLLTLAKVRSERPPPHLDSKMVCSWQGLAIAGLAKAAAALGRKDYIDRAVKAVEFVKRYLMEENGQLLRAAYRGDDDSGFHRYSVDEEWHVPHFEKMLYDQTQLLGVYADFCRLFGERFHSVVADIADYMEESLSHKEGGFYAAEDADSLPTATSDKKREGYFCVWECQKDQKIGDKDAVDIFCRYYDIHENGNVDRFKRFAIGELKPRKNVWRIRSLTSNFADCRLVYQNSALSGPPPHLDSKMVCSWQGLAIAGLAKAAAALGRKDYIDRAVKAVEFVKRYLMEENGQLLRAAKKMLIEEMMTVNPLGFFLTFSDDYAFLIQGLLELYQITADLQYLKMADGLQKEMDTLFWDKEKETGYYIASEQVDVKVRVMEDQDGAEPCANSVAVGNLVRLFDFLDKKEYKQKAEKIIRACSTRLAKYVEELLQIVVVGEASNELVKSFREEINTHYIWNNNSFLTERSEVYADMLKREEPTVFICANFTCGPPITSLDELKASLKQLVDQKM
ncbi:hypothetical protein COOONC_08981 [Cooperia oncophora]